MTKNPHAYDLFLKGVNVYAYAKSTDRTKNGLEAIKFLEEALRLDPNFPSAAQYLSIINTELASGWLWDPTERERHAEEAKRWAERAAQLMPGGAGVNALAYFCLSVERDAPRGLALAEKYLQPRPHDSDACVWIGLALERLGRVGAAEMQGRQAVALNPRER